MKTILFVCVRNSGRSQMAEAFARYISTSRLQAVSAGTKPALVIDPTVIRLMKEIGISLEGQRPKLLTPEMLQEADKVITMGCGASIGEICPVVLVPSEDWGIEDPHGKTEDEVRRIRDEIKRRVEGLVEQLDKLGKIA